MTLDSSGALYGTTLYGGTSTQHYGTVFKLTPPAAGHTHWTKAELHSFNGIDGAVPYGGVIFDSKGALYGTTSNKGKYGYGTVFKLTPPAAGHTQWTETLLHAFTSSSDGGGPQAGVVFDNTGALYGTTRYGGSVNAGTVFKVQQ